MGWIFWASYGTLWVVVVVILRLVFVVAQTVEGEGNSRVRRVEVGPRHGGEAPPLIDGAGATSTVERTGPRVVLFMDSGCRPCVERREALCAVTRDFDAVSFIVSCTGPARDVARFAGAWDASVTVIHDRFGENAAQWSIRGVPFAVSVDQHGLVVETQLNPLPGQVAALARRLSTRAQPSDKRPAGPAMRLDEVNA